jgi:predicted dehydrogenase
MEAFLGLVAGGSVDVRSLITHRYPFESALSVYDMITSGKEASLGVVLQYESKPEPARVLLSQKHAAAAKIGLGVIGAGNFAKGVLLPRLKANTVVQLQGVVTARGASARAVGEKFGFRYCSEKVEELLGDEMINTVLIATRHNLHGPLVRKCLEAGKHVFVEKPLCLTESELSSIVDLYSVPSPQSAKLPLLMVGFNRRFSPFIKRAYELVSKRTGPLVASYRVNPVEGGGRILGEVCHFVDTLRFQVDSPVVGVQAASIAGNDAQQTNRDSVSVTLTYGDGSVANILYYSNGSKDYPKEKIEIAFDSQTVVIDDYRSMEVLGRRREKASTQQDKGFDGEINAFVRGICGGSEMPVPFSEIVETTLVTFAIHDALNTGKAVFLSERYGHILNGLA